ncbi:MAG: hypothetical protein K0R50_4334 [Eubacterium sp.]|nr:hypothetical protein [Eubacterium sp.]
MAEFKRPILKIPLSYLEILEIVSLSGIITIFLYLFIAWEQIPEKVPTHFGSSGLPDSWGGRGSLLFLAFLIIPLYSLLTIISKFPHIFNYLCEITEANARFQYQNTRTMIVLLKTELIFIFGYIEWKSIQVAVGKASGLGTAFLPVLLLVVFGTIGIYIYRTIKYK